MAKKARKRSSKKRAKPVKRKGRVLRKAKPRTKAKPPSRKRTKLRGATKPEGLVAKVASAIHAVADTIEEAAALREKVEPPSTAESA